MYCDLEPIIVHKKLTNSLRNLAEKIQKYIFKLFRVVNNSPKKVDLHLDIL